MDMIGKFEETAKSLEQASAENVFLQQKLNDSDWQNSATMNKF